MTIAYIIGSAAALVPFYVWLRWARTPRRFKP